MADLPAHFGDGLARTDEDARLQADGLCTKTHPLLGRCGRSVWAEVHHLIPRSAGGHGGPQVCNCKADHDTWHPQPGTRLSTRFSLVVREQKNRWVHHTSGQKVIMDDDVAACVELAVPKGAKPGTILGAYQFGSVITGGCPNCGNMVPKNPDAISARWMDTSASGEFMRCPRCSFTYHGWVNLFWPQVESWWEERALKNHSAMRAYVQARDELDHNAGTVLLDMANGRLWTLFGVDTMKEYALLLGRAPQTLKNNLRAARLIDGLSSDVQEYARQLPVSLINARGGKMREMPLEQWADLVRRRDEEATLEELRAAIDELAQRARDIDKPSADPKVESIVEVFGNATSFEVRVRHLPDASRGEIIEAAKAAVRRKPGIIGVDWQKKGHQVKDAK